MTSNSSIPNCTVSLDLTTPLFNGLNIRITNPNAPNSFHAQIGTSKQLQDFDEFDQELNTWGNSCDSESTSFPQQGSYVLVKDKALWHRAVVTDTIEKGIRVLLIDVGRSLDIVTTDCICRQPHPKLLSKAQQALECFLVDSHPKSNWSAKDLELFRSLFDEAEELLCTVFPQQNAKWSVAVYHRKAAGLWESVGDRLDKLGVTKYIQLSEVDAYVNRLNADRIGGVVPLDVLEPTDNTSIYTQPSSSDSDPFSDHAPLGDDDIIIDSSSSSHKAVDSSDELATTEVINIGRFSGNIQATPPRTSDIPSKPVSLKKGPSLLPLHDDLFSSDSSTSEGDEVGTDSLAVNRLTPGDGRGTTSPAPLQQDDTDEVNGVPSSSSLNNKETSYSYRGTPRPKSHPNFKKYSYSCNSNYDKRGRRPGNPWWYAKKDNNETCGGERGRGRGCMEHCRQNSFNYPRTAHIMDSTHPVVPIPPTDSTHSSVAGFHGNNPSKFVQSDNTRQQATYTNPQYPLSGLTSNEAIKNEIEWLTYKIESETKKIQSLMQDPQVFIGSVSVILNGSNASKLGKIHTPGKPMSIVLILIFNWVMHNCAKEECVIQVVQELYGVFTDEVSAVFQDVCKEVFQKNFESSSEMTNADNKRIRLCSFFENFYLYCQKKKCINLLELITDSLCSFYSYWTTKLSSKESNSVNFESYVRCLCILCTAIGPDIDKRNRKKLDKYFEHVLPCIITGDTSLSKSLKLELLNLLRKRDRWLIDISSESLIPIPTGTSIEPSVPVVPPYTDNPMFTSSTPIMLPSSSTHHVKPHPSPIIMATNTPPPCSPTLNNNTTAASPYRLVSMMLHKLRLDDLLPVFKSGMIQDCVLSSKKQELKEVLKEVGVPPGAILAILDYVTDHYCRRNSEQITSPCVRHASISSLDSTSEQCHTPKGNLPYVPIVNDQCYPSSSPASPRDLPALISFQPKHEQVRNVQMMIRHQQEQPLPEVSESHAHTHNTVESPTTTVKNYPHAQRAMTPPTSIKEGGAHQINTGFGSAPVCVMCGSHEHRGFSCPKRSELLFASTDD